MLRKCIMYNICLSPCTVGGGGLMLCACMQNVEFIFVANLIGLFLQVILKMGFVLYVPSKNTSVLLYIQLRAFCQRLSSSIYNVSLK